ncbi:hypothetical protein [Winogradskyella forsetii]|uniref:hypothetical protein n=1 Tax=Winogradskyella forsetii TaxID=2686077 RepID=UPI0015B85323|nr:hypothetical protein [Winogradskyella forsetii]
MKKRFLLKYSIVFLIISCNNNGTKSENQNSKIAKFRFIISDTLAYGVNLARIFEYNRDFKENQSSVISVIMKNEMKDGSIRSDTFSDGLTTPFFWISRFKTGKQKIELKIEEKIMTTKEIANDSFSLEIKDIYYTYSFDVFVGDKGYKSILNERLKEQMDKEYAENPI